MCNCLQPIVKSEWLYCLIDTSESDSSVTGSAEEADTVKVQAAAVQLDTEQIALYKGSREYRTITVEHFYIGI